MRIKGKISGIISGNIQLSLKTNITIYKQWELFRIAHIPTGWNNKWSIFSKAENISFENSRDVADIKAKVRKFDEELAKLEITIKDWLEIKILNSLKERYNVFVSVFN